MGKRRLFSLMNGESVHLAPDERIIPADVFTKALSASDVLGRVQAEVEQYKQKVVEECEALRLQAQQEGFEQGFAQWVQQLALLEQEMASVNRATEKMIVPVALKAAQKIVGREIELSETAVTDIIASKLRTVKQSKQVVIYVNPEDLRQLEHNRERLVQVFEKLESLSIRPSEGLSRGSCVIETEVGIVNAQLDKQWEILEHAFKPMQS